MLQIPTIKVVSDDNMCELSKITLGTLANGEFEEFQELMNIYDCDQLNEIEPFPLTGCLKYKNDINESVENGKAMKYLQICHTNDDASAFSVVFRLSDSALMILDYVRVKETGKTLLVGKKFVLSKTEISEKWKVIPKFKKNGSTQVCGIQIAHFNEPEENFDKVEKKGW